MKRFRGSRLLIVALYMSSAACAALLANLGVKQGPIDHIKISHKLHYTNGLDCTDCHTTITSAQKLSKNILPVESTCLNCHDKEGNCTMCHTHPKHAAPWPTQTITLHFSHANHIKRVKGNCKRCHAQLPEPGIAASRPSMSVCLSCHVHREMYNQGKCAVCHVNLQKYPLKPIALFTHQGNWVAKHYQAARSSSATCMVCHDQRFCSDCHSKTVSMPIELKHTERPDRDFIHRDDWLSRHPFEARADPALCQRCHSTTFCRRCHEAWNVTPKAQSPLNPHPPGWASPTAGTLHAQAARRNIASCAACHDGPHPICVECHRVGGVGGNPHPPAWLRHHKRAEINGNGMCLTCHQ